MLWVCCHISIDDAVTDILQGPLLGPVIGPVAGGYLGSAEGWRWYDSNSSYLIYDNSANEPVPVGSSG